MESIKEMKLSLVFFLNFPSVNPLVNKNTNAQKRVKKIHNLMKARDHAHIEDIATLLTNWRCSGERGDQSVPGEGDVGGVSRIDWQRC